MSAERIDGHCAILDGSRQRGTAVLGRQVTGTQTQEQDNLCLLSVNVRFSVPRYNFAQRQD